MSQDKFSAMSEYIAAGYILTPLNGKTPVKKSWQKSAYDLDYDPRDYPGNFGVVLQNTDLVIDCDPRAYAPGDDPLPRFLDMCNSADILSKTFVVRTGKAGTHVYLKKKKDWSVKKRLPAFPGLEFLSYGCQVVGAYSIHPDTGKAYEYQNGTPKSVIYANDSIHIQLIKTPGEAPEAHSVLAPTKAVQDNSQATIDRFKDYLKTAEPCVQGQAGDAKAFDVAQEGYDLGLSWENTLACMLDGYNARCLPPWDAEDLKKKVRNAYKYSTGQQGALSPLTDFQAIQQKPDDALLGDIDKNAYGFPKKTLANCMRYFMMTTSPFYRQIAFDEFTDKIMVIEKMPWHQQNPPDEGVEWSDHDEILCKSFLCTTYDFEVPTLIIHEAIIASAWHNRNHPVKNYLGDLKWDGVKRLDHWLTKYCGVQDSAYTRAVGAKTLVAAVARIYHPGIKFDHMLILEGKQRSGKSRMVKALGGAWYRSMPINPLEKDTVAYMRGAWIIEEAELTFRNKADADHMKAFISREADVARLSYERNEKTFLRKCVFIGTYNPDAGGDGYMRDQTGNRRFWPVVVGDRLDVPGLESVRDQLFAEAVERYKAGERLYLEEAEELEAEVVQEERRQRDDRAGHIKDWLDQDEFGVRRDRTTGQEVWIKCMNGMPINYNKNAQREVGHILGKELQWENKMVRVSNAESKRMWCRKKTFAEEENAKKIDMLLFS